MVVFTHVDPNHTKQEEKRINDLISELSTANEDITASYVIRWVTLWFVGGIILRCLDLISWRKSMLHYVSITVSRTTLWSMSFAFSLCLIYREIPLPAHQMYSLIQGVGLTRLESKQAPILTQNELFRLANACTWHSLEFCFGYELGGIKGLQVIFPLVQSLHNSGVITYYRFAEKQKDIVVLNNVWFACFLGNLLDEVRCSCTL